MTVLGKPVEITLEQILFATDFCGSAATAGVYVLGLAERYRSETRVMHVIDLSSAFKSPDAGISLEAFRRIGSDSLSAVRDELAAHGIKTEALLGEAMSPVGSILEAAGKGTSLLVIGTRGKQGLAKLVLGSTAEQLIHRAECPILTVGPKVPRPQLPLNFQRIVYATDFSPEAAKACVFALSFAQDFGAHLYLFHVLPEDKSMLRVDGDELNARFTGVLRDLIPDVAREFCQPECVVEHGFAVEGILAMCERFRADLIVLGTRKQSHWYDNVLSGVAFQVISRCHCPVLTIRA